MSSTAWVQQSQALLKPILIIPHLPLPTFTNLRSMVWFPDSPHIAVLFKEEVSSKAQKGSHTLAQKQAYHEQEQQLMVKEEVRTPLPTNKIWWTLLLILILAVLGMSYWRKLTK
ncbi:MAG: hypothetical protein ABIP95_06795 [Pelobium sp.]